MAILIRCVVLRHFIDDHYRKMRVLRPGGITNLWLMTSRSILALALGQAIILDLSNSLYSKTKLHMIDLDDIMDMYSYE